jgi:hypothetical protein
MGMRGNLFVESANSQNLFVWRYESFGWHGGMGTEMDCKFTEQVYMLPRRVVVVLLSPHPVPTVAAKRML